MKVGNYNALMADCPAYQKCESFAVIFNILYLSSFVCQRNIDVQRSFTKNEHRYVKNIARIANAVQVTI